MQFFISAIQAELHEFADVDLGVGWVHIERTGTRAWVFQTQADGVGCDDIFVFSIKVSKSGRTHVRLLGIEEAFSEALQQEPTGTCHGGGRCYSISGLCDAGRLPKDWNGLCVYQTQQF